MDEHYPTAHLIRPQVNELLWFFYDYCRPDFRSYVNPERIAGFGEYFLMRVFDDLLCPKGFPSFEDVVVFGRVKAVLLTRYRAGDLLLDYEQYAQNLLSRIRGIESAHSQIFLGSFHYHLVDFMEGYLDYMHPKKPDVFY